MRSISMRMAMLLSFTVALNFSCGTTSSLASILGANPNLSGITSLLKSVGSMSKITGSNGPYTLLAPTNDALSKLGNNAVETLLKPENSDKLMGLLKQQTIPGNVTEDAIKSGTVKNAAGNPVNLGSASLGTPSKSKDGGMIYVVDQLLGMAK